MTHGNEWLPADLHIVSEWDLSLLQRAAVPPCMPAGRAGPAGPVGRVRPSPWSGGLDRVLDELDRRDVVPPRDVTTRR